MMVLFLLGLQIYLSNRLSTEGKNLQRLETEISTLWEENQKLKSETGEIVGLGKLSKIASEKGFIKNPKILNFKTDLPVALSPDEKKKI